MRALVAAPGGEIQVVSTHLAHSITNLSSLTRVVQNEVLQRWIAEFSHGSAVPVVLTGDFNSTPGTQVHSDVLGAGFLDTFGVARPAEEGFTSHQEIDAPAPTVASRIDYVFARPGACASPLGDGTGVLGSEVIGDSPLSIGPVFLWPSDHYGVVSELRPFPTAPDSCPVTFTARYTPEVCATLARLANLTDGAAIADVVRFGVDVFEALADAGRAIPVTPPANDGSCKVVVAFPASEVSTLEATAAAWGLTAEELTQSGGRLVLAIVYYLATHGLE